MIIATASGKGGTGKTTLTVNLARALSARGARVRVLDCDVEEPNAHLFLSRISTSVVPVTVRRPVWNADRCTGCGACARACRYNALACISGQVLVFSELCHACGVCTHVCPAGALEERESPVGTLRTGESDRLTLVDGVLDLKETLAPRVIHAVKTCIDPDPDTINLIDAPPGTGCAVVSTLQNVDGCMLVTEPTPFGLHDLRLAVNMTRELNVPVAIVINRSDGHDHLIESYADAVGVPVAGRIPFRRDFAEACSEGALLDSRDDGIDGHLLDIFDRLEPRVACAEAGPHELSLPGTPGAVPAAGQAAADGEPRSFTPRELVVISGKGGTGKTSVTASLAQRIPGLAMADADVDAADLHLLLHPTVRVSHDFSGGVHAVIDASACTGCGACAAACRFDAIPAGSSAAGAPVMFQVAAHACEGCGFCRHVCPAGAVTLEPNRTGVWHRSDTAWGPLVHAELGVAEENSGRLVAQVRQKGAEAAVETGRHHLLTDGPPGTGCPVIASLSGARAALVVTEPTVSGVHDMLRVLKLIQHFQVKPMLVINKADLNPEQVARIEAAAGEQSVAIVGRIPFDPAVQAALAEGRSMADSGGPAAAAVQEIAKTVEDGFRDMDDHGDGEKKGPVE